LNPFSKTEATRKFQPKSHLEWRDPWSLQRPAGVFIPSRGVHEIGARRNARLREEKA
jgi:hypothetical protein